MTLYLVFPQEVLAVYVYAASVNQLTSLQPDFSFQTMSLGKPLGATMYTGFLSTAKGLGLSGISKCKSVVTPAIFEVYQWVAGS